MDYTEIIEKEAQDYYDSGANGTGICYYTKKDFKAGAEYYKQITEIEVVKGQIEAYNNVLVNLLNKDDSTNRLALSWHIKDLEQLRDKLINELNKG